MLEVQRLYPQYNVIRDRRQNNTQVDVERRCGVERRSADRAYLDTKLTRDIFEIKSRVAQLDKTKSAQTDRVSFTQDVSKAAQNSIKTDQFVKINKTDNKQNAVKEAQSPSTAPLIAGVFACVMGGMVSAAFLGPVGVGVSIGIGSYFGAKLLTQAIKNHSDQ